MGPGHNTGPGRRVSTALDELLGAMAAEHGQRVSIVGWSLGGVYASALAARWPQRGPGRRDARQPAAARAPRAARRPDDVGVQPHRRHRAVAGVAAGTRARGGRTSRSAAATSASGTTRPCSSVVADRMAQPEDAWQPFIVPRWARRWIPDPVTT